MPFLEILTNWRVWVLLAFIAVLTVTHGWAYRKGAAQIQSQWNAQITQQAQETLRLAEVARKTEQSLQASAEKLRRTKNVEIHDLATKLADATNSLRKRPYRSDLPATPGAGSVRDGCTPADLYFEDAELALQIARDADQLLAYAKYCYAQYNKVRDKLNEK